MVLTPVFVFLMIYFALSFSYTRRTSQFNQITNTAFDRILVEGQFTTQIKAEMLDDFKKIGMEDITVEVSEAIVDDNNDATYVPRGSEIKIRIVHNKPHQFYYVNKLLSLGSIKEEAFYIGSSCSGMSEKL